MHTVVKWCLVKILLLIGLFFGLQGITKAQNAPVVTAGTVSNAVPGQQVTIPVSVVNFRNIGSVSLSLDYDPTKLQLISTTLNASLGGSSSYGDNVIATDKHRLVLGWYSVGGKTFSDGTVIVTYVFNYLSGSPSLQWYDDGGSCNFTNLTGTDLIDTPTSTYYKNGFVCPTMTSSTSITGANSICQGVSGVDYSVSLDPSFTYNWSYTGTGATIVGTTNAVKINFSNTATSGTLTVRATNACGSQTTGTKDIILNSLQSPTFTSGPTSVNIHSAGNVYTTQSGKTNYTWSVTGGTITTGGSSTDNSATITWNTIGNQSVSVKYDDPNVCMSSSPTVYPVTVNRTALTITGITASNKTYDRTNSANLNVGSAVLSGLVSPDQVILNTGSATGTFSDSKAGVSKQVTTSGFTITGTDANNYTLTQPVTSADITPKNLTISSIMASDKVYDRSTTATLNTASVALVGVVSSDVVTLNYNNATATFSDNKVGSVKQVTATGFTITGTDANNYSLSQPVLSANITPKNISVSGITANNKVYDGTTTATLNTASGNLVNVLGTDAVSLVSSGATGTFADKNVGINKNVTPSGLTISGTDASNYTLTQPVLTGNITPVSLTVTGITANNKNYDGNTSATLNTGSASLVGVIGSDAVTLVTSGAVGTFASKDVASGITVTTSGFTLGGAGAGNYTLIQPTTIATISPLGMAITIEGVTVANKVYDGTTAAVLNTTNARMVGIIASDVVNLSSANASGNFTDKNVGTDKSVVTTGFSISGVNAGNYTLMQPSLKANITSKNLTVSGITANNKNYDGNTTATLNTGSASLVGVIGSDAVTLVTSGAVGTFASKDAASGITVTTSGFSISGANAGNYTLIQPVTIANISPLSMAITIDGINAASKVYDGTTSAVINTTNARIVGVIAPDIVTLSTVTATGNFSDKNVGIDKSVVTSGFSISGVNAGNYTLMQPSLKANITSKNLTVSGITANNKTYDGTTTATLNSTAGILIGVLGNDAVSLVTSGATGAFGDKNVGTTKPVTASGFSISGADAGNYTLTQPVFTGNITPLSLTVSGVTANNKNYDGNTTVTLNTGSASLVGVIGSDAVTLVTSGAVGTFASKDAASGITVTTSGFTLGGANAGNYTLIQPVTIATILPLGMAIGIEGVTAANKVYDGTTTAVLNTTNARMVGVIAPDIVTLSTVNATGNFSDKNVGVDKSVVTSGFSISGVNAGNYTLMQPSLKANITSKNLTVSGITVINKTYDGTTTATLNTASGTLNGVLGTDAVSLVSSGASGAFVDKNAGQNKNVTPSGLSINGTDAINYTLAQPVLTGNILPRSLTIKAKDGSKCSGTTYNFSGNSFTADGLTNNDTVFSVTLSSTGVFQNANAGTYDIIAGNANGTTLTNYTITYIKGVLTVNPIANQPADFLISTSVVCLGTTGVAYTVPKDSLVTYTWNYTGTGVTINGKTNAVSLDFSQNASSGVLSVIATTSCGNSPPRKIDITVNTLNTKPVVTFTDNTLNSNIGTGIQWYRNMTPIQGATSQNYTPVENGKYFIVCKNNCISDTSNYVDVLISNTEQYMNNSTLQIFPNPAKEYFMLRSTAPMTGSIKLSIFSSDCILVRNYEINNKSFSKECQIDIRQLKPGLYFIRIDSAQKTTTKKLIIL